MTIAPLAEPYERLDEGRYEFGPIKVLYAKDRRTGHHVLHVIGTDGVACVLATPQGRKIEIELLGHE